MLNIFIVSLVLLNSFSHSNASDVASLKKLGVAPLSRKVLLHNQLVVDFPKQKPRNFLVQFSKVKARSAIVDDFSDKGYVWVNTSSLARTSDFSFINPQSVSLEVLERVQYGDVVHVRDSQALAAVIDHMDYISHPFVLYTDTWTAASIPSEYNLDSAVEKMLKSNKLLHWYTQNYDGTIHSNKISPVPLGPDFHTLEMKKKWGQGITSYVDQVNELQDIVSKVQPIKLREHKIYYDAHLVSNDVKNRQNTSRAWDVNKIFKPYPNYAFLSRKEIAEYFSGSDLFFMQNKGLSRLKQWQKRSKFSFSLSPIGNGLDCHRTWESLILGQIVLVPTGPLNKLYEGLPVVVIEDWKKEVTAENMEKWLDKFGDASSNQNYHERLSFMYWYEKLHSFKK